MPHQVAANLVGDTGVSAQPGVRQTCVQSMGQNPAAARDATRLQKSGLHMCPRK